MLILTIFCSPWPLCWYWPSFVANDLYVDIDHLFSLWPVCWYWPSFVAHDLYVDIDHLFSLWPVCWYWPSFVAHDLYVGLRDSSQSDQFQWLSGAHMYSSDTYWGNNQPENRRNGVSEDCGMINGNDGYRMHDISCAVALGFVCERRMI